MDKALSMILSFSTLFRRVELFSPLSFLYLIDLPDLAIIPGYFGTHTHAPRERATITLGKPMVVMESNSLDCVTVLRKVCPRNRLKRGEDLR